MRTQRDDEIIDPVRGIISGQDDCFILPLILFRVAVAAVFTYLDQKQLESDCCHKSVSETTHLSKLQAAEGLLLLQQKAKRRADSNERRNGWETFDNSENRNKTLSLSKSSRWR